ncbi:hypothetical protein ABBQ32_003089 [Trebouxia sp. C0010 RCD-2024]
MLDVATIIVYCGGYIFLVFLSVCLATGLYYLAELVEEYTKLAKRIITYSTQGVLILHLLVLVIDRLPLKCVAAGVAAHLCYLGQLKRYPFMQLWSPVTAGSIGFLILSNVLWGMHFWRDSWQSLEYIFGFLFLTTWIVPFSLFLSVTANESVLPGGANASRTFSSSSSNLAGADARRKPGKSKNILLYCFGLLKKKRDEVILPEVNNLMPGMVKNQQHRY